MTRSTRDNLLQERKREREREDLAGRNDSGGKESKARKKNREKERKKILPRIGGEFKVASCCGHQAMLNIGTPITQRGARTHRCP